MTPAPVIRVALIGFGSVGREFAGILRDYPELPLAITLAVDRGGFALDPHGLDPNTLIAAKALGSVARHESGTAANLDSPPIERSIADVMVEASSTNFATGEPGWSYVKAAIEAGLNVVLASKGPLVAHWDELFRLAEAKGVKVAFSASHGAPLPVIEMARAGFGGSRLLGIRALFNSTTGLILEAMERGASLDEGIVEARAGGVVETDPSLDVDGWDASAKCVIVARRVFGARLTLDEVDREGIRGLTTDQVQQAARQGTPIKLLCRIEPAGDRVRAFVSPAKLPAGDPLATLREGALGVVYDAEPVGPMFLAAYGKGGLATAAAVIRDIVAISGKTTGS